MGKREKRENCGFNRNRGIHEENIKFILNIATKI